MGMGEEMLSQLEGEYNAEYSYRESVADEIVENYKMGICFWETKDKKRMLIEHMDNQHLRNSYNIMKKASLNDERELSTLIPYAWCVVLKAEIIKREERNKFNKNQKNESKNN